MSKRKSKQEVGLLVRTSVILITSSKVDITKWSYPIHTSEKKHTRNHAKLLN